MVIRLSKEELIAKLEAQKAKAMLDDKAVEKQHKEEEKVALKKFRERLREALRWDYKTAKEKMMYGGSNLRLDSPRCPTRDAMTFERMIAAIQMDQRKAPYQIKDTSDLGRALAWLPKAERSPATVCD